MTGKHKCELGRGCTMTTDREDVHRTTKGIIERQEERKRIWIRDLRSMCVVAAHPDDAWVNRKASFVRMTYPTFDDGAKIGDLIALGDQSFCRVVKVIGRYEHGHGAVDYYFEPAAEHPKRKSLGKRMLQAMLKPFIR